MSASRFKKTIIMKSGVRRTSASELPSDPGKSATPIAESIARVKTRLGQHLHKVKQLASWDNACAVTGITDRCGPIERPAELCYNTRHLAISRV